MQERARARSGFSAESGHCARMHRCREGHGWPRVTIVQGCTGAAKAMDGREWPLCKDAPVPRRPWMAESGHCARMHRCREGHGWPRVAIVQGRTGAAKAMDGREWPATRNYAEPETALQGGSVPGQDRHHAKVLTAVMPDQQTFLTAVMPDQQTFPTAVMPDQRSCVWHPENPARHKLDPRSWLRQSWDDAFLQKAPILTG